MFTQDDPDLVSLEIEASLAEYEKYPTEAKQRFLPVLANRINTRRAIRDLVVPELTAIVATLGRIEERLDRLERLAASGDGKASP